MRKIYLFFLIFLISGISIYSEGSDIEFRLIEYFRNGNLSGIEKIIKCGKVQKEFVLLYEGQVAVLKRDYEGADKYFSEVMKFIKDKENRVYIVAEYLQNMMRLNEGFTWYKKKLINDYISHLETAKQKDESYTNRVKAYHLSEELIYIEPANPVNQLLYVKACLTLGFTFGTFIQINEIISKYPPKDINTLCEIAIARADSCHIENLKGNNTYSVMPTCIEDPRDRVKPDFGYKTNYHGYAILISMLYSPIIPKKYKEIAAKRLKTYSTNCFNLKKSKTIFLKDTIRCAELANKENEE